MTALLFTGYAYAGNEANVTRSVEVINVTPTLSSLSLESNATTVNKAKTVQLSVVGTYSDNSTNIVDENITYIITPVENAEVNGSVFTALKDGNVTVQAKVGTKLSNTLNLTIVWVVNGHVLPPEPDPAVNNSTLLGVDVNNNRVRDDVERWIYETYDEYTPCHQELDGEETLPSGQVIQFGKEVCEDNPVPYHPVVRAVAMQGARAAQIIIQEPEKARETREIFAKAYLCDSYIVQNKKITINAKEYKVLEKGVMRKEFDGIQFNTIQRARAYGKYNFNLSGGVYSLPTDDIILQGCSQEVHKLLEDLK